MTDIDRLRTELQDPLDVVPSRPVPRGHRHGRPRGGGDLTAGTASIRHGDGGAVANWTETSQERFETVSRPARIRAPFGSDKV